jgi:predicted short-subunit dehydrogenase-like oxidoreductase (DUF2520 family)
MRTEINPQPKPTVSIIGAGRLGRALSAALESCNYPILAVVTRRRGSAVKASKRLQGNPVALTANRLASLPPSDLILIATPDDVIAETARLLSQTLKTGKGITVLHTSGALASDVLDPLRRIGCETGSMHPLVSISDPVSGAWSLQYAHYCLEGTRKATTVARSLVRDLGGQSFTIKQKDKALYHAAAVMVSPHLVSLFDLASEMIAACGVRKRDARVAFAPLLQSTINNLKASEPQKALTGTFARGDIATVRRHLEALSLKKFAAAREVYKQLGLHSLDLMKNRGLAPDRVSDIRKLLLRTGGGNRGRGEGGK